MNHNGIDYFSRKHPLRSLASRVSFIVRGKIFQFFMYAMRPNENTFVLDLGATPDQSLPESNFFEQWYPYPQKIIASSFEDASFLVYQYPGVSFVRTEKMELPFADKSFDLVFCSAVLEHAGPREKQQKLIDEILRIGRSFFITTPNRWFPVEFHTILPIIHWLPKPIHRSFLKRINLFFWADVENLNLLSSHSIRKMFPQSCTVHLKKQRLIGMTSNVIVYGTSQYEK
jgi:SAM-dependent methyltransferase